MLRRAAWAAMLLAGVTTYQGEANAAGRSIDVDWQSHSGVQLSGSSITDHGIATGLVVVVSLVSDVIHNPGDIDKQFPILFPSFQFIPFKKDWGLNRKCFSWEYREGNKVVIVCLKDVLKVLLNYMDGKVIFRGRHKWCQVSLESCSYSWTMAGILQFKVKIESYAVWRPGNVANENVSAYPGTSFGFHFVKLPLHCCSLFLHDGKLFGGVFVPSLASSCYFRQLPIKNEVSGYRDAHSDQRQQCDYPGCPGRTPRSTIYGALMLLVGAAILAVAFNGINAPSKPAWIWIGAGGVFLLAAFFVIQGTVLLLAGRWII